MNRIEMIKSSNKKIVIWGCGKIGEECLDFLVRRGVEVSFFVDNNPYLYGKEMYGIKVISKDELLRSPFLFIPIIANLSSKIEIKTDLENHGFQKEYDYYDFYDIKQEEYLAQLENYVSLSRNTIYTRDFRVDIRQPLEKNKHLEIGENGIIGGNYIFERESGFISIGNRVHIGNSTFISINRIVIEDDVTIAWDCLFYDHDSHSVFWDERANDTLTEYSNYLLTENLLSNKNWSVVKSEPIIIKKRAWIGVGVTVLKGSVIGEGAVVGARSVVAGNIKPYTVVAGNPARVISEL